MFSLNDGCLFLFIYFFCYFYTSRSLSSILFCAFIKRLVKIFKIYFVSKKQLVLQSFFFQLNDVDSRDLLSKFGFGDVSNPADLQRIYINQLEDAFREGRYVGKTN